MAFTNLETNKILQYVNKKYATKPEFLWRKFPGNAILRRKDSKKWYGAILTIPKQKLGINEAGNVDILDLKCDPMLISSLIDKKSFFPGYHMNKTHWITILLDGSVKEKFLFSLIDQSYEISKK
ncbi:putative DNA-binding protein (MmcQ/YjbR family) [Elusimicrobium posterum]|uniref:MmcQ/YjbR family DNA-binding protein n=1 Tax=Elusimicrobium posterum TaxID=3116653 RepID=UPI003C750B50